MMKTLSLAVAGLLCAHALALPTDPVPTAGTVQIQQGPGVMQIQQASDRAIVNWSSFNIGSGELVRFLQPGPFAAILNRVGGADPSLILGTMTANGQVFLVNPNGIVFGKGSTVDVGSLLATTLTMRDQDFLSGHYVLAQDPAHELASVLNQGTLKSGPNGFVVLAAPTVTNEGLILANLGQVALVEGTRTTVSFDPEGLVQFEVDSSAVGPMLMTPTAASVVFAGVVRHPGKLEATGIQRCEDGQVRLTPDYTETQLLHLSDADIEAVLEAFLSDSTLRAFSNPFLSNLDASEPPGGFSASDLADFPSGMMLYDHEAWMDSLVDWDDF